MPVFEEPKTPEWTELYLIVSLLRRHGRLVRKKLWELVHGEQQKAMRRHFDFSPHAHTRRNFDYWLKSMEEDGIIWVADGEVSLDARGWWLSEATPERFLGRKNFLDTWLCTTCSNRRDAVLLTPSSTSYKTNAKGYGRMDAQCDRCGSRYAYHPLPEKMSRAQFQTFYNDSIRGLSRFLMVTGLSL